MSTNGSVDDDLLNSKDSEDVEVENDDDDGMKPSFFELASSLNVELVYVILKSIT